METFRINKQSSELSGTIRLPASKSISNRLLILDALSGHRLSISNLSEADDTQLLLQHLKTIQSPGSGLITLHCQNAGTVFRFLTALLAITPGTWLLDGSKRMKERPVGILVEALKSMGANIKYSGEPGYPPLTITGKPLQGGRVIMDASVSSQFISALMMIAPSIKGQLIVELQGKISSRPYIEMTLNLLRHFGIECSFVNNTITIHPSFLQQKEYKVEPDWSAAAFFYELAALSDKAEIFLPGLLEKSLQGDAILPQLFRFLGVKSYFEDHGLRLIKTARQSNRLEHDFTNHPDLAQAVIVTCAALGIKGKFTGLESLRIKESDRILALATELKKIGAHCKIHPDDSFELLGFYTKSGALDPPPVFHSHGDHRMAMALSPLALVCQSVNIEDPMVVSKSFPGFWDSLKKMGFIITSSPC